MRRMILYYSRSGVSRRVAEKLAKRLRVNIYEIEDKNDYSGIFGYLKGGFYASRWKKVSYDLGTEIIVDGHTHVYLIGPVWASRTAPAIYSFLMDYPLKYKTLILTNDGSTPEKAYAKMEERFGEFTGKYCVTKSKKNEDAVIDRIVEEGTW